MQPSQPSPPYLDFPTNSDGSALSASFTPAHLGQKPPAKMDNDAGANFFELSRMSAETDSIVQKAAGKMSSEVRINQRDSVTMKNEVPRQKGRGSVEEDKRAKFGYGMICKEDKGIREDDERIYLENERIRKEDARIIQKQVRLPLSTIVTGLLNSLTMETFNPISNQIMDSANESDIETDTGNLVQVTDLIFECAIKGPRWSEVCAHLCRKMVEHISPQVHGYRSQDAKGTLLTGGEIVQGHLLNRCQEEFERNGNVQESAVDSVNFTTSRRQRGLGLVKFIGELFKLQVVTESIIHRCVEKLLRIDNTLEEASIESLCTLLATVGPTLDTRKNRAGLDVYVSRMEELTRSEHVNQYMQHILLDVIELHDRAWNTRKGASHDLPYCLRAIFCSDNVRIVVRIDLNSVAFIINVVAMMHERDLLPPEIPPVTP